MLDFSLFEGVGPEDWGNIIETWKKEIIKHYEIKTLSNGCVSVPTKEDFVRQPEKSALQFQKIEQARQVVHAVVTEGRRNGIFPEASVPHLKKLYQELGITNSVP